MNILSTLGWVIAALIVSGSPAKPVEIATSTNVYAPWLEKLAVCESQNTDVINHNDGGSPSFAWLQFKYGTFKTYARKYNVFPNTEDEELMNLIMDRDAQMLLAATMLEHESLAWKHWKNCTLGNVELGVKAIGLPPKPLLEATSTQR